MDVKQKLKLMDQIRADNEAHVKEWKKGMSKKLTGVLLDNATGQMVKVTVPNTLEGLYAALSCDLIEVAVRAIGCKPFTVICDEEGLMKEELYLTGLMASTGEVAFVGSILIVGAGADADGDFISLTDDEIETVLYHKVRSQGRDILLCDYMRG